MLCGMESKKDTVRGIRFESALWDLIDREAKKSHRTPAGQVRHLLEQELQREGLLAAENEAIYDIREKPGIGKRSLKKSSEMKH